MNSGEFLNPPSGLGSQNRERRNPNVLSESGQEEKFRKFVKGVGNKVLAGLLVIGVSVAAHGNQARAVEIDDNGQISELNQGAKTVVREGNKEVATIDIALKRIKQERREKCDKFFVGVEGGQLEIQSDGSLLVTSDNKKLSENATRFYYDCVDQYQ